jgi:2,5-diamino-6-(ribosylamino)-4(3H)-pyrimidinone 5'-phosphate reductase
MTDGTGRPRVLLNCAISLDGRLAYAHARRAHLSGPHDLARVMRIRAGVDAILVGVNTVLIDDPALRVHWERIGGPQGRSPIRVVLDSRGRVPDGAKVLDGSAPTIVATARGCTRPFPPTVTHLEFGEGRVDLPALLAELSGRGIASILVEGGAEVLASFLRGGLFDELTVYLAPVVIGGLTAPSMVTGPETPGPLQAIGLERVAAVPLDDGVLMTFRPGARAPL